MAQRLLTSPFLTTVATAATLLVGVGCGTSVVFEDPAGSGGAATGQGGGGAQGGTGQGGSGGGKTPCPIDPPSQGGTCAGDTVCTYELDCDVVTATCDGATWNVFYEAFECNPPPPQPCDGYTDPSLCEGDPACRWIVPGCGPNPLDDARCFPTVGCDQDPQSCTDKETCAQISHNPCWNGACQACDTPVYVCLGDDSDV